MSELLEVLTEAIRAFERQGGTVDAALWAVKDVFKKPRQPVRRGESEEHRARNDEIAARLRAGASIAAMSRATGLCEGRVRQIARSRGIGTSAVPDAALNERNKRMVEMQQAGMKVSHIAKAVGLSTTRATQILAAHARRAKYGSLKNKPQKGKTP